MGTGTSQGVPVIGCKCEVCQSKDNKDIRLRSSALLCLGDVNIVIDTGPDFRQQMLIQKVDHLSAILITHEHNDHVAGLDDIRPFNFMQREAITVYTTSRVMDDLKIKYAYVFAETKYPGAPSVDFHKIGHEPFMIRDVEIHPIHFMHGRMPVVGFKVGDFAYLTDIKSIEEKEAAKLVGIKTLVVSALHHKEHHSHFNLTEALAFIERINPQKAYLTHISHSMGCSITVNKSLPKGVQLAHDGLDIDINL